MDYIGYVRSIEIEKNEKGSNTINYDIYQLKEIKETRDIRYKDTDFLKKNDICISRENYDMVYKGSLEKTDLPTDELLEKLFEKFNLNHPSDFKGHSLSISDIVVLHRENTSQSYYVDSVGFTEIMGFTEGKQEEILKTLEELKLEGLGDDVDLPEDFARNVAITAKYDAPQCSMCDDGTWTLIIGGVDVSNRIPRDAYPEGSLNTKNTYSNFNGSDEEDMEFYEGGFDKSEWIEINHAWLETITKDPVLWGRIFEEIQKNEFTGCDQCGGCI